MPRTTPPTPPTPPAASPRSSDAAEPTGRRAQGLRDRRARILAAAKATLLGTDADALSMRQLAADAGLSVATVYNLYGSKEAVLVGLLEDELERIFGTAHAEPAGRRAATTQAAGPTSVLRCRALVETALARYTREAALFRPLLGAVERQNATGRRSALIGKMTGLLSVALADGVAAGELLADLPVEFVARQIVWGFIHAIRYWSIGDLDDDGLRAQTRSVVELSLLAVAAPRTRPALTERLARLAPRLRTLSPDMPAAALDRSR